MEEEEELSADVSNIFKSIQAACEELTQRGQEYLLVTADPASQSCMKIGSEKGRQFLDVNSELVINFFSYCFGAQIIENLGDQNETTNQTDIPGNIIDSLDTPTDIKQPTINQPIDTTIEEDKEQVSTNTDSSNDRTEVFPDLQLVTQTTDRKPSTGTVTHTDQPEQQLISSGLPTSQSDEKIISSREQGEKDLQKLEHSKKQISKEINCTEQPTESNLEDLSAHEEVHKDLDLASEESTLPQIVSESQTLGIDSKNEKIGDELAEIVDAIPAVNENSTDSETDNQADSTKAQIESGGLNDSTKVQSESGGLNDSVKVQSEFGILNDSTKVQSESDDLNDSTEAQPKSGDLNDSIIAQSEPCGLNDSIEAQSQHELIKQDKSFVAEKMVTRKGNQKAKSSISSMDGEKKSQILKEATNLLDKEISNVKATKQAKNITKNTNLRPVTSETKLTKKKQSKNKNAMIIPEEKAEDKPSKPTCTVCKATFSRIHSLKGHMLIIHQLEVSMEELQREPAQTSIEQKKESIPPTKKKQAQNSASKNMSYPSNDSEMTSDKNAKSSLVTETAETLSENNASSQVQMILQCGSIEQDAEITRIFEKDKQHKVQLKIKSEPLSDEEQDEAEVHKVKRRKLFTRDEVDDSKKIKHENSDQESSEQDIVALTTIDLINSLSSGNSSKEGASQENYMMQSEDNIIVLEENHDENVPSANKGKKNQKPEKKQEDVYCELCDKNFQKAFNLTIHNIRFHPSIIMKQFGVDMVTQVKQEVVDEDIGLIDNQIEEDDNQHDNLNDSTQENEEMDNSDSVVDPMDRLQEIKQNEQIKKYITITEQENNTLLLSCNNCQFSCEEFHQVLVHIARIHPELSADLDLMMSCFYGIKTFNKKCDECPLIFKSVSRLWSHIVQEHPESVENCSKKKRLRHLINKYKSKKSFVRCDICGEHLRSMRALDNHMAMHPEAGRRYQCPQCSQSFSTKPNMTRHFKQIHLEEKKFQCDICGRSFSQKETLKYHRQTHEEEKDKPRLFECHICNKKLRKKESLQIHLRQHEGIKPYICEYCGMAFTQNGNRIKHVQLIHNEDRSLECTKCGKSFKLQEHLKRHMKMHLIREGEIPADKTYLCEYPGCGARYTTSTQLKVHTMSKHTNERPWTCSTCNKGFTTRDKLLRHEQTHVEGLYDCEICHKKLQSKEGLAIHTKYHQIGHESDHFEVSVHDFETVIIPQENGAPIKVQLAHSEPITTDIANVGGVSSEDTTYYLQTSKSDEVEEDSIQVDDNTILVDPSVLESVLGATSDEQTVYYYVTGN
ncbi:uncharacterized protein LOC127700845 [Mytilus californianus]|uniref:uncharacterized protein LOC127700845 n=1 Tax=Mytilus californianus TaxID=6549 RepID=UPI0022462FCD|nr:uncharacterized protein LOC127700845 [Mytilus californianus]